MAFDSFLISCDLPCPSASDHDNSILLETWIILPLNWAKTSPGFTDRSLSNSKGFTLASAGLVVIKCPLQLFQHSPAYCLHTKDLQKFKVWLRKSFSMDSEKQHGDIFSPSSHALFFTSLFLPCTCLHMWSTGFSDGDFSPVTIILVQKPLFQPWFGGKFPVSWVRFKYGSNGGLSPHGQAICLYVLFLQYANRTDVGLESEGCRFSPELYHIQAV